MPIHGVEIVALLFVVVLALAAVSRRLVLPYPILLVLGGLALALVPGLPEVRLEPDVVFLIFLPPILWAAAYFTSFRDFRRNLRAITLLAFGLVLATTAGVAFVAHHLVGLSWPAAVALGAIVSPPDAVAATAILRRLRIPHRVVVVLEGESLVNDATALILYRSAVAALVAGQFDPGAAVGQFFIAGIGGVAVGLAVSGVGLVALRWVDDRLTETAITLIAPYIAWSVAERLHTSAVLACVAGGLLARRYFSSIVPPATRLQARAVWDLLVFALNGVIFILIGLQLRTLVEAVPPGALPRLVWQGLLVSLAAIVVRLVWVPIAAIGPRLIPKIRARDPMPPWRVVAVVAWTGMRGVVSLAAALALPLTTAEGRPLPYRETIILLTFVVILVTLVVQGLSLAPIIRWLRLPPDDTLAREQAHARAHAMGMAMERIAKIAEEPWAVPEQVERLRKFYQRRERAAEARRGDGPPASSLSEAAYKRALYETLKAERQALIALRDEGVVGDDVLLELEEELDREAARDGLADIRVPAAAARPRKPRRQESS